MKKKLSMAAMLIVALLLIVGCSGTPGSANNALPEWLADKTWAGSVTMTGEGEFPGEGSDVTRPMTIKAGTNDFYFTGEGSMNQNGLKAQLDEQGVAYRESKSNSSYSINVSNWTLDQEVPGQGSITMTIDLTITFTKTSDISLNFSATEITTGTFFGEPINASMSMSGDLTRQ